MLFCYFSSWCFLYGIFNQVFLAYLSVFDPERLKIVEPSKTIKENRHEVNTARFTCLVAAVVTFNKCFFNLQIYGVLSFLLFNDIRATGSKESEVESVRNDEMVELTNSRQTEEMLSDDENKQLQKE